MCGRSVCMAAPPSDGGDRLAVCCSARLTIYAESLGRGILGRETMRESGKGSERTCQCLAGQRSSRSGFLALVSFIGLELAIIPARADPASERPKEGDFLVSIESEGTDALALKDVPLGGPPVLAWPMDPASNTVRKESRLN